MNNLKKQAAQIRWKNWEYWSSKAFYFPMWVWGPLLALRSGHPCFFTAANPGIFTGGMGFESKIQTILKIPEVYRPKTILAPAAAPFELILVEMSAAGIGFPVIAKPDLGFRGFLVQKIDSPQALQTYLKQYPADFIIQEFVWKEGEFGILYHRFPGAQSGHITSVTLKEFLRITGDGQSTVLELIERHPRALLQMERLQNTYGHLFSKIPEQGEQIPLGVIGNHSKGTKFISGNQLINKELIAVFDDIANQIPGFNYGRFDIKCGSWEHLLQGKDITILEINGVCSEPTHIYDPQCSSYWEALYEIMRHWSIIRRVAAANHRLGTPYLKPGEMLRTIYQSLKSMKQLEKRATISQSESFIPKQARYEHGYFKSRGAQ